MIKTLVAGIVIGISGAIAAAWFMPIVDQSREVSLISVSPNGGNAEEFHINIPGDRIMASAAGAGPVLPEGMAWPEVAILGKTNVELYKLRNTRNAVIGVASRLAMRDELAGNVVEWTLHLPARGSLYVTLGSALDGNRRTGSLRAGTREFEGIAGSVSESWVRNSGDMDSLTDGRIEIVATTISTALPGNADEAEDAE